MKVKISGIILLIVFTAIILAVSGCTSPGTTPTAGVSPTPTPAPTTTTIGKGIQLFDQTRFHTFEYRIFATDGSIVRHMGDMKAEYDMVPYGNVSSARHMKETRVTSQNNETVTTVTDLYYNPANNIILGGRVNVTSASATQESEIPADDPKYWNYDMSSISSNVEFYDLGTEVVTVPMDSFLTKKYTSTDSGVTMWMADGVPVPIKIAGNSTSSGVTITTSLELINYE